METINPKTYRECSVPKPPEQAQKDWEAFCDAVYKLRIEHKIPDVYLVARIVVQYEDSGEGVAHTRAHFGDDLLAEPMTAWAFGYEQSLRQERIAAMIGASKSLRHVKDAK